jgi:hypothetical protein
MQSNGIRMFGVSKSTQVHILYCYVLLSLFIMDIEFLYSFERPLYCTMQVLCFYSNISKFSIRILLLASSMRQVGVFTV